MGGEPVEQVAQPVGELLLGVVLSQPAGEPRNQRVLRLVDADRSGVRSDFSRHAPDGGAGQRANWLPSAPVPAPQLATPALRAGRSTLVGTVRDLPRFRPDSSGVEHMQRVRRLRSPVGPGPL